MTSVLGIDAAWGPKAPSGVALVSGQPRQGKRGGWRVLAVAPSAETFCALAEGQAIDWGARSFAGGTVQAARLIEAARALGGEDVVCAAVDMPLARRRITGRRPCDNAIARRYVGVHSPLPGRPGVFGRALQRGFERQGFALATAGGQAPARALLEVYPHAALMVLLGLSERFPYKVSRSARYWPELSAAHRVRKLAAQWYALRTVLEFELGPIPLPLPRSAKDATLARMKRYEDSLDAVICAWVGALYLEGQAEAFGDDDAAVWVPR
jgi:predicted RNase H-like nuclease